jgi:hypothetical protein
MAEIVVRRNSAFWQDRGRKYRVFVDDEEATVVGRGEEVRIPVDAGRHVVHLKIDWCKSPSVEIQVEAGAVEVLECGPNCKPLLELLYVTVFRNRYLWLRLAGQIVPGRAAA